MNNSLSHLAPFVQFKESEKHRWRSITFVSKSNTFKNNTPPWVFFTLFELYRWHKIGQSVTCEILDKNVFFYNSQRISESAESF